MIISREHLFAQEKNGVKSVQSGFFREELSEGIMNGPAGCDVEFRV